MYDLNVYVCSLACILSILVPCTPRLVDDRTTVALCLMTKDQNDDIREWVEYHHKIGITNIIIFDNNSSQPCINAIQDFISSGFVNYYAFDPESVQREVYNNCLKLFGPKYSHIGFIDTDEFIVIKNSSMTIIDVVEPYKFLPGLTLNAMFIGSNGHRKRPPGGVLSNYNKCEKNAMIKVIVNTKLTIANIGPHHFRHTEGKFPVDTNFNTVSGRFNPAKDQTPMDSLYDIAYINHYILKSFEDFTRKHQRGSGDKRRREMEFFNITDLRMTGDCEFLSPPPRRVGGGIRVR